MEKGDIKVLGIIPARGGSKGIPGKNIKILNGKPLLVWSVESALKSKVFDRLMIATEDKEIAEIAKEYGATQPFFLPEELTQYDSSILDVIEYVLSKLKVDHEEEYDAVMLLEPTNPLRTVDHIHEGLRLFMEKDTDSVVGVSRVPPDFNPHWQFTLEEGNQLKVFTGEDIKDVIPRKQMLSTTYTRDGVLYVFKPELLFRDKKTIYGEKVHALVIEDANSCNIDEMNDWVIVEKKMKDLKM